MVPCSLDAYLSLLGEQPAQHMQRLQKGQKACQYVLRKSNPLEDRANRAKKRVFKAVERILLEDCVWR